MKQVIGNKAYSSWSLRPWVLMKHFMIPFGEVLIKLDPPNTTQEIKKYSQSGKVPALVDGDLIILESMAIMKYLHEKYQKKFLYPAGPQQRTMARVLANQMHGRFSSLCQYMSFHRHKPI